MKKFVSTVYEGLINWVVTISDIIIEVRKLKAEQFARKYTKV
jgi:hypothetical protein